MKIKIEKLLAKLKSYSQKRYTFPINFLLILLRYAPDDWNNNKIWGMRNEKINCTMHCAVPFLSFWVQASLMSNRNFIFFIVGNMWKLIICSMSSFYLLWYDKWAFMKHFVRWQYFNFEVILFLTIRLLAIVNICLIFELQ